MPANVTWQMSGTKTTVCGRGARWDFWLLLGLACMAGLAASCGPEPRGRVGGTDRGGRVADTGGDADVALSGDRATLAVGAYGEASASTGIGGDQADDSAMFAGAAYVFH